ncbi:MAG: phosphohistidine phosphatase SixA [Pirellulales bacterium]|jgi:phosphohistidine phosphatase
MSLITTHLYIARHAWAEDIGEDGTDFSRSLTKKGIRRFRKMARRLAEAGMQVDVIATSPLVRTRQTAEILSEELFEHPPVVTVEALAPGSDWGTLLEWTLEQHVAHVAWVGHNPCVGRLIAMAIGDGSALIRMQKGSVASIRLDDGLGHPGELTWLASADLIDP